MQNMCLYPCCYSMCRRYICHFTTCILFIIAINTHSNITYWGRGFMEDRVQSIETQIALMQKDISELRSKTLELPPWLRKSAIGVLGMMLIQIGSTIWWAAELTTKQNALIKEVGENSQFREDFAVMHTETMVRLKEIQVDSGHMKSMLMEVKNKLRFVDIKQQQKQEQ